MMSPDEVKALEDKLDSIAGDVKEIRTVLLGVPNTDDKGVVGTLNDVCNNHVALKNKVYLTVGLLAGSGILTGAGLGIWQAVK